ncbi:tRNA lysidine(34) synthetase TilS [Urechidicola vernalis]|uniref:tRNA(Ile)-lysidine synthase n=1 Tax=Urechidicola vernalis TaxID=3075600 RepID=A0ABU2Y5V9_9FLAO|nr:tRNA lysidine(34) synthetase TilS [Urechidicola sp. P050]MDT0553596.1 tRNA lysidine(34) synthetase TilS [Urechidicola sp. P050]
MISNFKNHINTRFSFLKEKKLLVAVSGGIDSVVLTHLLYQLKQPIAIAHCNFNLRGTESDSDSEFVNTLAGDLGITHFSTSFETEKIAKEKGISIQMAARDLRYEWFEKIRIQEKFDYILTAHNKDDVLETLLINLTRGTGLKGLTGIPEINGVIVRPLLKYSREEILHFAKKNKILWQEDSSNASTKYIRNKLRHDVIPVLKELNPNLMDALNNTLNHLNGSKEIINKAVEDFCKTAVTKKGKVTEISISHLTELENPKPYLFEILSSYGFSEWDDVSNMIHGQTGKFVLSKTHRLLKNREHLQLTKLENNNKKQSFQIHSLDQFKTDEFEIIFTRVLEKNTINNISVDISKLIFPLTIRRWRNGDYFYPSGMLGKKKVSKFFKDEKLSLIEKENAWILENGNQDIIWIVNLRPDRRFELSKEKKDFVQISFSLH